MKKLRVLMALTTFLAVLDYRALVTLFGLANAVTTVLRSLACAGWR